VGSVCAFVVEERMAFLSTAISAALVASIVYYAIAKSRSAEPASVKSR
jgi:cytosine permease